VLSVTTSGAAPDILKSWTFATDGSWAVDVLDFTNYEITDQVELNGEMRLVAHSHESWSAAWAAVEAQIPRVAGLACRFDF
jgi:hypothetical protein